MILKLKRFCHLKLIKKNLKNIKSNLVYIMDNLVAEASDVMSPALDFGLPKTAQYVTDRRHVNYFPSGSNVYKSDGSGNLNIRFYITGEDGTYLDLSSIRLFANLKNNDVESHFLRPLSGLHGFFSRYRCTVGGQLVQDIDQYNRHCELYNSFKSADADTLMILKARLILVGMMTGDINTLMDLNSL